jgi:uncharacterized protein (DUF1684 family)
MPHSATPRVFVIAAAFLGAATLPGAADIPAPPNSAAEAEWEKWREEENAAWSTKQFAILKIDDAVYLNEGQSAWLTTRMQKVLQHAFTLEAPSAPSPFKVTYTPPTAHVTFNGKSETFTLEKTREVAISPGIDVRFQLAQTKPGVDGLRVIVYNQANPVAKEFQGLEHFAYNADAVVEASFEPAPSIEGVDFQTSRGWFKRFYRAGFAVFTLDGKQIRLPMYAGDVDPKKIDSLSAFFMDNLTGKETYGVGRYIDVDVKGFPPKTVALDFNRAYNPNCSRSPHYNCPVAIDTIAVELRAGERKPSGH